MDLSIVIPFYNEDKNIPLLLEEIYQALRPTNWSYEVVAIDDRSRDGTYELLKKELRRVPHFQLMRFRKNFGQTAAIAAGFDSAKGAIIVTLDGDLQNDPADIPRLMEKMSEGYDIVSGWRGEKTGSLYHQTTALPLGQ